MKYRIATLVIVALTAVSCLAQRRAPLDPLTEDERQLATKIAQENPRVRELLGNEGYPVYSQFISVKRGAANEPSGRTADVLFYHPSRNIGVRALVDLLGQTVVDVVTVPGHSVPLGAGDVERAVAIAASDAGLSRLLGTDVRQFRVLRGPITRERSRGNIIEGLRTLGTAPDDPCTIHRCVQLLFSRDGEYLMMDQQVTVDLTTRQLLLVRGAQR